MALSPIMKQGIRRVADVLGAYARVRGWWPRDFRLYFRADQRWGRIHFQFLSDGFSEPDEHENYQSVKEYLQVRLSDDPALYLAVSLVNRTFRKLREGGLYAIREDFSPVRPRDLNKLAIREVAALVDKYASDRRWDEGDYRFLYKQEAAGSDKVRMVVYVQVGSADRDALNVELRDYITSRLFDEPEIVYTADLTLEVVDKIDQEAIDKKGPSGFKDYHTMSRVKHLE